MKVKMLVTCLIISILTSTWFFMDSHAEPQPIYNAEGIYELADSAVFYIRIPRSDGTAKATGTGVVVSTDGTAVTAYHVVKGAEDIEGILHDGQVVSGITLLAYDELTDSAILKLPDLESIPGKTEPEYDSLPIRESAVKYGEKVFAIGYPLKNTPIITEGIVNNPKAEINGRDRILASAQVASGMSGGPILDEQGRLAGIISGSMRTMNNIHLVINTEDILSLIEHKE